MHGKVTSYNSGTGALEANITTVGGSGTISSWNVKLEPAPGTSGTSGTSGGIAISNNISGSILVAQGAPSVILEGSNTMLLVDDRLQVTASNSSYSGSMDITGSLDVSGSVVLSGSFSGSYEGLIDSASNAINAVTSSHTLGTASFADIATSSSIASTAGTASVATRANGLADTVTASFADSATTSSHTDGTASFADLASDARTATSSSQAENSTSASYSYDLVIEGSQQLTGSMLISGSGHITTGSLSISGSLGVGTEASGVVGAILATNDVVAFASSDERLKENITLIENPLEKIDQL